MSPRVSNVIFSFASSSTTRGRLPLNCTYIFSRNARRGSCGQAGTSSRCARRAHSESLLLCGRLPMWVVRKHGSNDKDSPFALRGFQGGEQPMHRMGGEQKETGA